MNRLFTLVATALVLTPATASACGGLFCNSAQPVNQSAERIFFARDGDTTHMHVQITYAGPPQDFGWLLPTPADVQTFVGTELLFRTLDQSYGPRFVLSQEFSERCNVAQRGGINAPTANESDGAGGGGMEPGVQVLSREAVGPYDRTILQADNVQVLREWLDANEYQIPDATDPKLQPYIDAGAVFVALKLLPGTDSGDVSPIHLTFTSPSPAVPIVPTAVAADPDMGIIVHLLGEHRAIPKNYGHVKINEAAIDWLSGGQNYADVVSQAADEAQGKAFTTDFAGDGGALDAVVPYRAEQLAAVAEAATLRAVFEALGYFIDADAERVLSSKFDVPEGVNPAQFFGCPDCFGEVDWEAELDGAAISAQLETVNAARETIVKLLQSQRYLTRLYTTMSAVEMDEDPIFSFNPDLEEVSATRNAVQHFDCDRQGNFIDSYIEVNGLRVKVDVEQNTVAGTITRQDGETVRGRETLGARVIEQLPEAGPAMVVEDRTSQLQARYDAAFSPTGNSGCDGCSTTDDLPGPGTFAFLVFLLGLRLRRPRL